MSSSPRPPCMPCPRYVAVLHFTWLVNSAAHLFGMKPYDKTIGPSENRSSSLLHPCQPSLQPPPGWCQCWPWARASTTTTTPSPTTTVPVSGDSGSTSPPGSLTLWPGWDRHMTSGRASCKQVEWRFVFSKRRPSGPILYISRNVHICVCECVCLLTF